VNPCLFTGSNEGRHARLSTLAARVKRIEKPPIHTASRIEPRRSTAGPPSSTVGPSVFPNAKGSLTIVSPCRTVRVPLHNEDPSRPNHFHVTVRCSKAASDTQSGRRPDVQLQRKISADRDWRTDRGGKTRRSAIDFFRGWIGARIVKLQWSRSGYFQLASTGRFQMSQRDTIEQIDKR